MGRTIILTEDELEMAKQRIKPDKYTFNNNIRRFLNVLLSDPVHAEIPKSVSAMGVSKSKLLDLMKKIGLIEYSERLDDKNPDGTFKDKATMKIKYKVLDKVPDAEEYRVPKNKFDEKIEKLRIMVFEKNVPDGVTDDELEECTSCGSAGLGGDNTIVTPLFGVIRRSPKNNSKS